MKKTISTAVLLVLTLSGCGNLYQLNNSINDSVNQLTGAYSAPTLASSPSPSGCGNDSRCQQLDDLEAKGYEAVHQKRVTWTKLVSVFYEGRRMLYPNSNDSAYTRELISFQRVLAEQMDAGKITETQWGYLIPESVTSIPPADITD